MDEYENDCKYNLAETCCASISLDDLCALSEDKIASAGSLISTSQKLTYGEIPGTTALRDNLSRLYSSKVGTPLSPDKIVITNGAIAANHLVFYALLREGDHVICHFPTYQQLYSVPESLGAKVDLWRSKEDNGWLPDFAELEAMVTDETKMIILKSVHLSPVFLKHTDILAHSNPQNPTGSILPKPLLAQIIALAESKNITILSDEVYRPIFHSIGPMSPDFPPSILSMGYRNTIATGSLSKAYALAGIRTGWAASRNDEIVAKLASARHYTTIAVSQLDQAVAAFALGKETVHALLSRNIALAKANVELVERFVVKHDEYCSWTKPVAGTTAFVKFERDGKPVKAVEFCKALQQKSGVMLLPGDFGFGEEWRGYVRIGYVNSTEVVKEGLEELRKFMRKEFDDVPVHED